MYDIVFISYQELNAEENWLKLKSRFPMAMRVHGVKGIHQAHIRAAKKAFTKMFWVVDGDAEVLDSFDFNYQTPTNQLNTVHVWRSRNPINDLEYGNGGVKLLPRQMTIDMDTSRTDMTTSISNHFKAVQEVSNTTLFNTDPFNTWRSAFRECAKLAGKVIDRQKNDETEYRLDVWCSVGKNRTFGKFALAGALAGKLYGTENAQNPTEMKKINDFEYLKNIYDVTDVEEKCK
jgi:hypothetical protein